MELIYTDKDGNQTKFTQDMVTAALDERAELRIKLQNKDTEWLSSLNNTAKLRDKVYEFFNNRYDSNDEDIVCTKDDVNELLESIGASKLAVMFTVNGTISFTITDVEAESEEDARDIVEQYISAEWGGDGTLDDWSVEIDDASQQ